MTIDGADRIHVVWFTQTRDLPRLYLATSMDHGTTFSQPVLFDSTQKMAKHAHLAVVSGNSLLISWDDLNEGSVVKWGLFDTASRSLKLLGTERQASYPIIATSGKEIGVVAASIR